MGGVGSGVKRNGGEVKALSLKVTPALHRRLDNMAFVSEQSMADLMRRYIDEGLQRDEAKRANANLNAQQGTNNNAVEGDW